MFARSVGAPVLLLTSCLVGNIDEDSLPAQYAGPICKNLQRCERGYFESEYSDMADCRDEVADNLEDLVDYADDQDCDFDEDEAKECLQSINSVSCEDWYEGDASDDCEDVFEGCGLF